LDEGEQENARRRGQMDKGIKLAAPAPEKPKTQPQPQKKNYSAERARADAAGKAADKRAVKYGELRKQQVAADAAAKSVEAKVRADAKPGSRLGGQKQTMKTTPVSRQSTIKPSPKKETQASKPTGNSKPMNTGAPTAQPKNKYATTDEIRDAKYQDYKDDRADRKKRQKQSDRKKSWNNFTGGVSKVGKVAGDVAKTAFKQDEPDVKSVEGNTPDIKSREKSYVR